MASMRHAEAIAAFRRALEIRPAFPEAHTNLGILLEKEGHLAQAEMHFRLSLTGNPESPETLSNLADLLAKSKRFDEAVDLYEKSLSLKPSAATWSNYAVLLTCLKRDSDAEKAFGQSLQLDPENPNTRFNYAYLLLQKGYFREGWINLESRHAGRINVPDLPFRRWQGESLEGKSILIWPELGFGDQIQFCRYAPLLKERGASKVVMACQKELEALFSTLEGVETMPLCMPEAHFDYYSMPLSLPLHFDSIPAKPYLHALPERIDNWRESIPDGKTRIGVTWQGNPLHENDDMRSLPSLSLLKPLAELDGISWVSLQKNSTEAKFPPFQLVDLGGKTEDFADTAAIVSMLDLVISVDTSVAHLAGALGKPCWILLPDYKTDWRWLDERNDSPWYPSVRLFRQKRDWESVLQEVRDALASRLIPAQ